MSSSAAGKFQDHYEVLGISPKADTAAVEEAYATLSEQYARDPKKLDELSLALEVLTDAELRRSFNAVKGISEQETVQFSGASFFDALSRDAGLRTAILCVLYDLRRLKTYRPSISLRQLEMVVDGSTEEMAFALWYLKQRNLVTNDDKSRLQITVTGIDLIDQQRPSADLVLPFIKAAAQPAPSATGKDNGPSAAQTAAAMNIVNLLRKGGEPARA